MKLRQITLPYPFLVSYIAPGCRNTTREIASESTQFDIPDVSGEEAPVIADWLQLDSAKEYQIEPPHRLLRRGFDGRVYEPLLHDRDVAAADIRPDNQPVRRAFRNLDFPVFQKTSHYRSYGDERNPFAYQSRYALVSRAERRATRGQAAREVCDDREARRAEAVAVWRNSLVVIDGSVWRVGDEPVFTVDHRTPHGEEPCVELDIVLAGGARVETSHIFRADRGAEALAFAQEMAARLGERAKVTGDLLLSPCPSRLVTDEALLAATAMLGSLGSTDFSLSGLGTPDEVRAPLNEARELYRSLPEGKCRDAGAARRAFDLYERFVSLLPDPVPPEWSDAVKWLHKGGPHHARWREGLAVTVHESLVPDEAEALALTGPRCA